MSFASLLGLVILVLALAAWLVLSWSVIEPVLWLVYPVGLSRREGWCARRRRWLACAAAASSTTSAAGRRSPGRSPLRPAGPTTSAWRPGSKDSWASRARSGPRVWSAAGRHCREPGPARRGPRPHAQRGGLRRRAGARGCAGWWPTSGRWPTRRSAATGTVMRLGVRRDVASAQTRFLAFAAARVRRQPLIDEPSATDAGLRWAGRRRTTDRRFRHAALAAASAGDPAGDALAQADAQAARARSAAARPGRVRGRSAGVRAGPARAVDRRGGGLARAEPDPPGRAVQGLDAAFAGPARTRLAARVQVLTTVTKADAALADIFRRSVAEDSAQLASRAQIPLSALTEAGGVWCCAPSCSPSREAEPGAAPAHPAEAQAAGGRGAARVEQPAPRARAGGAAPGSSCGA